MAQTPSTAGSGTDPHPEKPEPPLPAECCESGCAMCVWDVYNDKMQAWREAMAQWRLRHPDAEDRRGLEPSPTPR